MLLECSRGSVFTSIEFASYGTPSGSCGSFAQGLCHLETTNGSVTQACIGKNACALTVSNTTFNSDPCPGTTKYLAVQAKCSAQTNNTHWNFTLIDPLMEDFLGATSPRDVVINFSTTPDWMWVTPTDTPVPSDPTAVDWSYNQGNALRDPSFKQLANYYARLLAWYTKGGFVDEAGVKHTSGFFYNISHWEILNEVESEHQQSPQFYTALYDAVVSAMREVQPDMKFVGMALAYHREWSWWFYFLNQSNHVSGVPLDYVSFHFYASATSRTDPNAYDAFFPQCDDFIEEVAQIIVIRDELSPTTQLFIDEVGVILPDDTAPNPAAFPLVYWNAAAAEFAYLFGNLAAQNVSWLGMSQLVGYPSQFPSVSMVNWTTGEMTPRYWTLQLLLNHYRGGAGAVYLTYVNVDGVFAQGFANPTRTLLLVNKQNAAQAVGLTADWQNAKYECVDENSGFSPAPTKVLTDHTNLPLQPFGVCVVTYPSQ